MPPDQALEELTAPSELFPDDLGEIDDVPTLERVYLDTYPRCIPAMFVTITFARLQSEAHSIFPG